MRTNFFKLLCLLISGVLILSACNLPSNNAPAEPEQPTINALATVELTDTPTKQAEPTETPTETATETLTPEPSETATPEPPMARVGRETNCRIGPGSLYDLVATYQTEQMLEIVAKDLGGGYWFVRNPEKPEEECYLLANNITISGDTSALPKFTPLPSPTAAPYFKVTFKKFDSCEGRDYAVFIVDNTGSIPFRSFYIKLTNKKGDKSDDQVLNAFDQRVHCVLAKIINPLNPGESGFVTSPEIEWKAGNNLIRAVIMLCTDQNLKGTCITQSVDVKIK